MSACGKSVPVVSSVCVQPLAENRMPVVKGKVGNTSVNVLRDTGCSGIVVKKELVAEDQYTGECNHIYGTNRWYSEERSSCEDLCGYSLSHWYC